MDKPAIIFFDPRSAGEGTAVLSMRDLGFSISPVHDAESFRKLTTHDANKIIIMNLSHKCLPDDIHSLSALLMDHDLPLLFVVGDDTGPELLQKSESLISCGYIPESHIATLLPMAIRSAISQHNRQKDRINELENDRDLLNLFLEHSPSYVFFKDDHIRSIKLSKNYETMIGRPIEELLNKSMFDLFPSDLAKGMVADDEKILREGKPLEVVEELNGRYYSTTKFPIIRKDHPPLLAGFTIDITPLKMTERALRESEMKHRLLFESTRDAVMILENDSFVDCNEATLTMFRCDSRDQFISHHPYDFSPPEQPGGENSKKTSREHIQRAMDRGSHLFEWTHRRRDGGIFPAEVMLSVLGLEGKKYVQALVRDITERKSHENRLKHLAATDPLTSIDNRRSFFEKAEYEISRSRRYSYPLSFLMIDIDHFKSINDAHGHFFGDMVLRSLVEKTRQVLRESDILGRLGGEEFAVILIDADRDRALEVAHRLRNEISTTRVSMDNTTADFTISIGLTSLMENDDNAQDPLKRADSAMYESKRMGRDRVHFQ